MDVSEIIIAIKHTAAVFTGTFTLSAVPLISWLALNENCLELYYRFPRSREIAKILGGQSFAGHPVFIHLSRLTSKVTSSLDNYSRQNNPNIAKI